MSYHDVATSSASDDWPTDPAVFAALAREFGPFDLDVCASADNAKCPRFYTQADDGLRQPWEGRVWMNPPYGRTIGQWMNKARQAGAEGALVVCLVPARPDTAWWRESTAGASLVRIFPGRLRFGHLEAPAPFPSALIVLGPLAGRHGTKPARCARCNGWFFPARADAATCSARCRQALKRAGAAGAAGQSTDGFVQGPLPGPGEVAVYVLENADGVFYVGSTENPYARVSAHRKRFGRDITMTIARCVPAAIRAVEEMREVVAQHDLGRPVVNLAVPSEGVSRQTPGAVSQKRADNPDTDEPNKRDRKATRRRNTDDPD